MIPVIEKASLTVAKYTKLFKDVSQETLTSISTTLATFDNTTGLYDHVLAMYRYYEICDENESVFLQCINDIFEEYKDYYTQLKTAYANDIDISKITERVSSREDNSIGSNTASASSSNSSTSKEYDLPNRQVAPGSESGYLSTMSTDEGSNSGSSSESRENTYTSDNTTKDNRDFIRAKEEYLRHIRDIYEEFASRFTDCFLHIF